MAIFLGQKCGNVGKCVCVCVCVCVGARACMCVRACVCAGATGRRQAYHTFWIMVLLFTVVYRVNMEWIKNRENGEAVVTFPTCNAREHSLQSCHIGWWHFTDFHFRTGLPAEQFVQNAFALLYIYPLSDGNIYKYMPHALKCIYSISGIATILAQKSSSCSDLWSDPCINDGQSSCLSFAPRHVFLDGWLDGQQVSSGKSHGVYMMPFYWLFAVMLFSFDYAGYMTTYFFKTVSFLANPLSLGKKFGLWGLTTF
jgi:hypothetical protein